MAACGAGGAGAGAESEGEALHGDAVMVEVGGGARGGIGARRQWARMSAGESGVWVTPRGARE
jgi:hypothetical protein